MKAAINKPGVKLVDARTQGEIDGKDLRNIKRGGFIESSVPVYWEDTLDPTTQGLQARRGDHEAVSRQGHHRRRQRHVYCQVGMRASHDLFTLALIGHDLTKLRNYYGAWEEEWGQSG